MVKESESAKTRVSYRDNERFYHYLYERVLDDTARQLIDLIQQDTNVFVFSGVIRDYFMDSPSLPRDLDLVIQNDIDWNRIKNYFNDSITFSENSFGGLKININNFNIDIWEIGNTWGLTRKRLEHTPKKLAETAFFNFSAIVYSINDRKFYHHKSFNKFLENRHIDILYEENPNIKLCIINSLFYQNKLNLPLSDDLKEWVSKNYSIFKNYKPVQIHHWNKKLYSHFDLFLFYLKCKYK